MPSGPDLPTAVADLGSNTVHLLVAQVRGNVCHPVVDRSVALRLGDLVTAEGALGSRRAELLTTVRKMGDAARRKRAGGVAVVGTEPFRRAADALTIAAEVGETLGTPMHILSHEEEGLLSAIGAMRLTPASATTLVLDIGGGSTECVLLSPGRVPVVWAAKVGSGRLTERLSDDPPAKNDVERVMSAAAAAMSELPFASVEHVVVVGGGARVVAKLAGSRELALEDLARVRRRLGMSSSVKIASAFKVPEWRARRSLATVAILQAGLGHFDRRTLEVSWSGIREGLALAVANAGPQWRMALPALAAGIPA